MLSRMTQEEFFEILKKTPRSWRKLGDFICDESEDPITVVGRMKLGDAFVEGCCYEVRAIIKALGLNPMHGEEIALAMLGYHDSHPPLVTLRQQLLEACGLPPD